MFQTEGLASLVTQRQVRECSRCGIGPGSGLLQLACGVQRGVVREETDCGLPCGLRRCFEAAGGNLRFVLRALGNSCRIVGSGSACCGANLRVRRVSLEVWAP